MSDEEKKEETRKNPWKRFLDLSTSLLQCDDVASVRYIFVRVSMAFAPACFPMQRSACFDRFGIAPDFDKLV